MLKQTESSLATLLFTLFFLFAGFMSGPFCSGTAEAAADYYSIVYKADGVSVTLELNGTEVMKSDYKFSGAGSMPLNQWTRAGANTLKVKLKPLKKGKDEYMKYDLLLSRDQEGQMAGDGEKLWQFFWESNSSPEQLPFEKEFLFFI